MRSRVLIKQITYTGLSLALLLFGLYLFVWGFSTLDSVFNNAPDPNDYGRVWEWQNASSAYNVSHFVEMLEGFAAFPAGLFMLFLSWTSAACSLDVTKGEREKKERRKAEKARKILEARRAHVRSLIDETRSILESVERDATHAEDELKLVSVKFMRSELQRASEMFETEEATVEDAEREISILNSQAKALTKFTIPNVAEETPYSILGVSPKATPKEIKDARDRKIWFYHEDHTKGYPDWAKQEANKMAKKINNAYDELLKSKNTKSAGS